MMKRREEWNGIRKKKNLGRKRKMNNEGRKELIKITKTLGKYCLNFFFCNSCFLLLNSVWNYIRVMNPVIYLILCFNLLILNDLNNAYRYHSKTLCLQSLYPTWFGITTIHFNSLLCYHFTAMWWFVWRPCVCHISWDTKFVSQLCNITLLQYLIWVMTWYFNLD